MHDSPAEPDVRALAEPPDPAALAAFRAQEGGLLGRGGITELMTGAAAGLFVCVATILLGSIGNALLQQFTGLDLGAFAVVAVPIGFVAGAATAVLMTLVASRAATLRRYRLETVARANGFSYATGGEPWLPGLVFGEGHSRTLDEYFRATSGRAIEFGNARYTTGSGKNRRTHQWGYLAVRLDAPLPHMVLDAKGNNALFGTSNLPAAFARDQVLSLEGDFDRYFTLYAPREYERDALYVFTPDLMALLIDHGAAFDVELVDDWLIFYTDGVVDYADPETWRRVRRLVDVVAAKAVRQGARYRDEHLAVAATTRADASGNALPLAPPRIAEPGRRLRRGVPPAVVVVAIVVVLWFVFGSGLFRLGG